MGNNACAADDGSNKHSNGCNKKKKKFRCQCALKCRPNKKT